MAAREVVELGKSLGRRNFILEGDALEVVKALRKEEDNLGSYGQIVNNVKLLKNCRAQWKVQYVRWEGNGATHHLIKLGLKQNET